MFAALSCDLSNTSKLLIKSNFYEKSKFSREQALVSQAVISVRSLYEYH